MTDVVTVQQLRRDRQRQERERALAGAATSLHLVLAHLRVAAHHNETAALRLDLPGERQILDAIGQCERLHQLDKANGR